MNNAFFNKARPIFIQKNTSEPVVSCGYRADFTADGDGETVKLNITGRSFYRLYINGVIVMHGPARTAKGYLRVDELDISRHVKKGINFIAIEQISFANPYGGYSNDITLEDGTIIFELFDADGKTLAYSSEDTYAVLLKNRHKKTERRTHCREATEVWNIDESYFGWRCGEIGADFIKSTVVPENFKLLPRRMRYPEMKRETGAFLSEFGTFSRSGEYEPKFYEKPILASYSEYEDRVLRDINLTCEKAGNADVRYIRDGVAVQVKNNAFLSYDFNESFVGFVGFTVKTDGDIMIDIVATEIYDTDGAPLYEFNTGTRLYIKKGSYSFVRFDPALARYIRLYITGNAAVEITDLHILTYSYPDLHEGFFTCSDDDVNRLYNAARKTLILNTLDIFMDCPDRERGGWLCDSYWTARAAALMLGDTSVEKAFIENFLLTDPKLYHYAFFPAVYPNSSPSYPSHEISTWSFWLLAELAEYVKRTGDIEFIREHKARIDAFIEGALTLRGDSGLLENIPIVFIDWSFANRRTHVQPISVPANALFAFALREYGKMSGERRITELADEISSVLKSAVMSCCSEPGRIPDSMRFENGIFFDNGEYSEAAHFTTLWSELFDCNVGNDKRDQVNAVKLNVIDKMGPAPKFKSNPNIGKSGLFIGECIRLDMLSKFGRADTVFDELKAIYYPQLREGPGTLWENEVIETSSRCHGFTSHAGFQLTRDILGLTPPNEADKTIVIAPNPMNLRWARGVAKTGCGCMSVSFINENGNFTLNAVVPSAYKCEVKLPSCVKGLEDENVKIDIVYV